MTSRGAAAAPARSRTLLGVWAIACTLLACGETAAGRAGNRATVESADALEQHHLRPQMSPKELFVRGMALARSGQLVRAEQYLSLAVASGYPQERALPVLIGVCLSSSRLRAALNYAEPYLARHPRAWALRHLVGAIYAALGQSERAREELHKVLRDRPAHAPAHYLLAVISRDETGDRLAASQSFRAYLKHSPDGEHAAEAAAWLREQAAGGVP